MFSHREHPGCKAAADDCLESIMRHRVHLLKSSVHSSTLCQGPKSQHLLDEDLPQPGLPARVVLQVELVEAVEDVLVRVHVQRVHVQVVPAGRQNLGFSIGRLVSDRWTSARVMLAADMKDSHGLAPHAGLPAACMQGFVSEHSWLLGCEGTGRLAAGPSLVYAPTPACAPYTRCSRSHHLPHRCIYSHRLSRLAHHCSGQASTVAPARAVLPGASSCNWAMPRHEHTPRPEP
jgi:hypothetical protein